MNIKKIIMSISAGMIVGVLSVLPSFADTLPTVDFESPTYSLGNINGQDGWMKTGAYDSEVVDVSTFSNASGFGFGDQALRISNAVTSGAFGDQTFTPGLTDSASESLAVNYFEASFSIGSTQSVQQPGLFLSVSPDDGLGSRMSYVGFDDQADGIHLIFYDVVNSGPLGTVSSFNSTDVMTVDRANAHTVKFEMELIPGPANDVVRLYVDGVLKHTGTSWEDYYRYDPEQNGNGNVVPAISKVLFRAGGSAAGGTLGNGYLIDSVSLASGPIPSPTETPTPTPINPFDVPEQCNQNIAYNLIEGTNGSNVINGTNGADLILAKGGSDKIYGNGGSDCIVAGSGSDVVYGGNGNDVILGGIGADSIYGDNGQDTIYGEGGADVMRGGNGKDKLIGGSGWDSARGENGKDTCVAEAKATCEL